MLGWLAERVAEEKDGEDSDYGLAYIMLHNMVTKDGAYLEKAAYLDGDYKMNETEWAILNKAKKEVEERINAVKLMNKKETITTIRLTRDLIVKLEKQGHLSKEDLGQA